MTISDIISYTYNCPYVQNSLCSELLTAIASSMTTFIHTYGDSSMYKIVHNKKLSVGNLLLLYIYKFIFL